MLLYVVVIICISELQNYLKIDCNATVKVFMLFVLPIYLCVYKTCKLLLFPKVTVFDTICDGILLAILKYIEFSDEAIALISR